MHMPKYLLAFLTAAIGYLPLAVLQDVILFLFHCRLTRVMMTELPESSVCIKRSLVLDEG